jgi:sortase (surface protein transpeptidase)
MRAGGLPSAVKNPNPAPPIRVEIPAVGLDAPVVAVGLNPGGSIDMPAPDLAGWYRYGPAPGAIGPAVLVGHVDMRSGPAVFYRLTAARTGDRITVVQADGDPVSFIVTAVTQMRKAAFPTAMVFAPTPQPTLRLVTCAGDFDPRSGHYLDSFIVWAAGPAS